MEFLGVLVPRATTLAAVYNPANPSNVNVLLPSLRRESSARGISLIELAFKSTADLESTLPTLVAERRPNALQLIADSFVLDQSDRIAALALAQRLPTFASVAEVAYGGALLAYGLIVAEILHLSCCRFDGHPVWVFHEAGGFRSDETVGQQLKASFLASDRTYGARRVWRDLLADGAECGLHRIERLMRLQALRARPRRRRPPKDEGDRQVANVPLNLLDRQFVAERPSQRWIADFTYIWTAESWLYVGRHRPVLAPGGWLVDERQHDGPAGRRRPVDGRLAARQAGCPDASLGSGQPGRIQTVVATP